MHSMVAMSRGMHTFINRTSKELTPRLLVSRYSATFQPHLKYCVHTRDSLRGCHMVRTWYKTLQLS